MGSKCAPKGSVKSVRSVRERNVLRERKRHPPYEKNFPTTFISRPVGVTSHTTPLPAGEGTGEGPPIIDIRRPSQGLKQRSKKKA